MAKHMWSYRSSSQLRPCAVPTCKQWKATELDPWPPNQPSQHQHSVLRSSTLLPALPCALAHGIVTAPGLPQPAEPNVTIWWVLKKGKPFNYPARKGELVKWVLLPGGFAAGKRNQSFTTVLLWRAMTNILRQLCLVTEPSDGTASEEQLLPFVGSETLLHSSPLSDHPCPGSVTWCISSAIGRMLSSVTPIPAKLHCLIKCT